MSLDDEAPATSGRARDAVSEHVRMRGADVMRAGIPQLGLAAIAVEHADRRHAVGPGADHVMAAVADHDRVARIDLGFLERVSEQVALVDAPAVQLGAEYALEIVAQAEMGDDAL